MEAGAFLTRCFLYKVTGRFHVQLFAFVVADPRRLFAAGLAGALFGLYSDSSFDAWQVGWQLLAARMPAALPPRFSDDIRIAPGFGLHFFAAHAGLAFE